LSVLVSPRSYAQVTRTTRFGTELSEAHDGKEVAAFGDSPILTIRYTSVDAAVVTVT
jgi:hypothetical protein